jgi:hypothetical protein
MAKDWSYAALDDLIQTGQIKRPAEPRFYAEQLPGRDLRLGLAGLSLLAGTMAALLYVWPVLLLTTILSGMRATVFWPVLAGGAVLASLVTWTITSREKRHWAENWQEVGDWADPPILEISGALEVTRAVIGSHLSHFGDRHVRFFGLRSQRVAGGYSSPPRVGKRAIASTETG